MSRQRLLTLRLPLPITALCCGVVCSCLAPALRADRFQLASGGRLEGVWLDPDQDPVTQYTIQLPSGGQLVLAAQSVREVRQDPPLQQQYQLFAASQRDDVPGQWAIAQWCAEHGMKQQRQDHLTRLLRHDPNHGPARRALGYTYVKGRWVQQKQYMEERGYVHYRSRWRLPQEVALLEARREQETAQVQWYRQIKYWRRELADGDQANRYYELIAGVRDPQAVVPLIRLMQQESARGMRMLYVRTLANMDTPVARHALLNIALADYDLEIMHFCFDQLVQAPSSDIHERALKTLGNDSNDKVNRAAVLLRRLNHKEDCAILIDALITQHDEPRLNRMTKEWELCTVSRTNPEVLTALVAITGNPGYGFDQQAWRHWRMMDVRKDHAREARHVPVRRDVVGAGPDR